MASINFYLDTPDKKGYSPIYLRVNCNREQVKVSTGEKVKLDDFDKTAQLVVEANQESTSMNFFLTNLKEKADKIVNKADKKTFTNVELKAKLTALVKSHKEGTKVNVVKEQMPLYGRAFTFIDLFAGAGGFSEGFLQAENNKKYFDFLVGNDINENCELTHVARYNHQLGLDAKFLCQDITEPDFLKNLLKQVDGKTVDVVCGGPPCQSFSLAGKRRKFDKKDDLFSHYLQVIKALQPKYFVMENVKGILTKDHGKIKERILEEIRSLVDIKEVPKLEKFVKNLRKNNPTEGFLMDCLVNRVGFEGLTGTDLEAFKEQYIKRVEAKFRALTPKIVDYKTSKTDERVNTIRHGFNLLLRSQQLKNLQRLVIKEKDLSNLDGDYFVNGFTDFLSELDSQSILDKIEEAFKKLEVPKAYYNECNDILDALLIYARPFGVCIDRILRFCNEDERKSLLEILKKLQLYQIEAPFVANASNYGVPQNRERVLFIGCRKDQKLIKDIPATVPEKDKVTVFEALYDLDVIGNNEEVPDYEEVDISKQFNGTAKKMAELIRKRSIDGKNGKLGEKTYAEWSKGGRLLERFKITAPFYVKNAEALKNGEKEFAELHNHKTSNQNDDVIKRLEIILAAGDYNEAKVRLNECGLSSQKRNYNVLKPEGQSPTVMTIPDDYVHYNSPRALTVREMARLQSFDDSFVFQGKRSTGGNKRKFEVPQFTLVGNAVPPLMARAVAMELLKNIK